MAELVAMIDASGTHRVLRFSECDLNEGTGMPFRRGYRWASARTDCIATMRLLCALWNHRHEIADLIRRQP